MSERIIMGVLDLLRPGMLRRRLLQLGLAMAVVLHVWVWAVAGSGVVQERRKRRRRARRDTVADHLRLAEQRIRGRRTDAAEEMLREWRQLVGEVLGSAAAAQPSRRSRPVSPPPPQAPTDPVVDALASRLAARPGSAASAPGGYPRPDSRRG